MGGERNQRLAGKIMIRQKGRNRRGHRVPPVRRADENHVILIELFRHGDEFRFEPGVDLFASLRHHVLVNFGVGCFRLDLEDVSTGFLLDHMGDLPGIAEGVGEVGDQYLMRSGRNDAVRIGLLCERLLRRFSAAGKSQYRNEGGRQCFPDIVFHGNQFLFYCFRRYFPKKSSSFGRVIFR